MKFEEIWDIHSNIRSYLHFACEGEYYAIAFIHYLRLYIEKEIESSDFEIYHSDVNTITFVSEDVDVLHDILIMAFPAIDSQVDLSGDGHLYLDMSIMDLLEFFGDKLVEFGDDS